MYFFSFNFELWDEIAVDHDEIHIHDPSRMFRSGVAGTFQVLAWRSWAAQQWPNFSCWLGVSIAMGDTPIAGWFTVGNPINIFKNGWFWGAPISGNFESNRIFRSVWWQSPISWTSSDGRTHDINQQVFCTVPISISRIMFSCWGWFF